MSLTREERKAILASIPWVDRLEKPKPCEGYRWSSMPLKAIYTMGGKPPVGKEKWRCKKLAHWRFRAKRNSWAKTGNYCWSHLFSSGLHHDQIESDRLDEWMKGQGY